MAVSSSPYATRSPHMASSGGASGSTMLCDSFDAHSSMPLDLTPRILRGLRLHSTKTSRSCSNCQNGLETCLTSLLFHSDDSSSPFACNSQSRRIASCLPMGTAPKHLYIVTCPNMCKSAAVALCHNPSKQSQRLGCYMTYTAFHHYLSLLVCQTY